MKWNHFLLRRLSLLRLRVIHLPAGSERLQTPRSPAGTGWPALRCLALPEIRPVWRRLAEWRQRPLPHQHPQGALWRHTRGRRAFLRLPRQEHVCLRRLLLPPVTRKDEQRLNHNRETEVHYMWSLNMWTKVLLRKKCYCYLMQTEPKTSILEVYGLCYVNVLHPRVFQNSMT